jgi:hypothetical protein
MVVREAQSKFRTDLAGIRENLLRNERSDFQSWDEENDDTKIFAANYRFEAARAHFVVPNPHRDVMFSHIGCRENRTASFHFAVNYPSIRSARMLP